jgi:hypothetical protein
MKPHNLMVREEKARICLDCCPTPKGIVAKRNYNPYIVGEAQWIKIRNTTYPQWGDGRSCSSANGKPIYSFTYGIRA